MTDILTRLAALTEHPKSSEVREHIRRGYGFRAVGAERVWSLHDDEMQALNTGFTCLDDRCKSLIALVQEAAAEIEKTREAFKRFLSQAMTYRKMNTDEWVEWFEDEALKDAKEFLNLQEVIS